MTKAYERHLEKLERTPAVALTLTTEDARTLMATGEFDATWATLGRLTRTLAIHRSNRRWVKEWAPMWNQFYRALGGNS